MTYKEASKAFGDEVPDLSLETLELAKKAVEKQIPKKPTSGVDRTWGTPMKEAICPVCDYTLGRWKFFGGGKKITYCELCGQAIDWDGWKWTD